MKFSNFSKFKNSLIFLQNLNFGGKRLCEKNRGESGLRNTCANGILKSKSTKHY